MEIPRFRRPHLHPKDWRSTHIGLVKEPPKLLADFFTRSATMWEKEREKLLKE